MKRTYSSSDYEEDEDCIGDRLAEGENDETAARKKRRGLIEKKRRDRINSCLTELRRLVPAALEKQGSAKLEKAEILQMTVEHLKGLRNASVCGRGRVPSNLNRVTDYRAVGFQECLSEVARYMSAVDDPECKDHKAQIMNHLTGRTLQRLVPTPGAVFPTTRLQPALPIVWPLGLAATPTFYQNRTSNFPVKDVKIKTERSEVENAESEAKYSSGNSSEAISNSPAHHTAPTSAGFTLPMLPLCRSNSISFGIPLSGHRVDLPFAVFQNGGAKVPLLSPWGPAMA